MGRKDSPSLAMDRRAFGRLAGGAALGAAAAEWSAAEAAPAPAAPVRTRALMKVGTQHDSSDEMLAVLAALGVNHICSTLPSARLDEHWSVEGLTKLRERVESFGITLDMVPLPLSSHPIARAENPNIMLGQAARSATARSTTICTDDPQHRPGRHPGAEIQHEHPRRRAHRAHAGPRRARGTARSRTRRRAQEPRAHGGRAGPADVYWERITYFLERVVPVAEEHKVRLACHPHDPGMPHDKGYRGVHTVLGSVEGLKRFVEHPREPVSRPQLLPGHGLRDARRTRASEIFDVIRYFGSRGKIFNVHFRNIQGRFLDFRETFIDDGDVDMLQAMRVYKEVGYDGMMMPDHVPKIAGDAGGRAGLRLHVRLHQGADPGRGRGGLTFGHSTRVPRRRCRGDRHGRDGAARWARTGSRASAIPIPPSRSSIRASRSTASTRPRSSASAPGYRWCGGPGLVRRRPLSALERHPEQPHHEVGGGDGRGQRLPQAVEQRQRQHARPAGPARHLRARRAARDAHRVRRHDHRDRRRFEGKPLNSPNDVVCKSDGSIWFTDPPFGILGYYEGHMAKPELPTNVYRVDPGRRAAGGRGGRRQPAQRPRVLARRVEALRRGGGHIAALDPRLRRRGRRHALAQQAHARSTPAPGTPDGLRVDVDGNLWVGWGMGEEGLDGVSVFNPDGKLDRPHRPARALREPLLRRRASQPALHVRAARRCIRCS